MACRRTRSDCAVPAATPSPDKPRPQWNRLNVTELELVRHLTAKADGQESRAGATERLVLTIGPKKWADSPEVNYTQQIQLDFVRITPVPQNGSTEGRGDKSGSS